MALVYKELPYDYSIRVLVVLPDLSTEGFIQCWLQDASIYHEYICLSYVWGPPTENPPFVLINDHSTLIRPNLMQFPETARVKLPWKALWIDAICINQANNMEKSLQVQQMDLIFSSAQQVIAWLGVSERVSQYLENLATPLTHLDLELKDLREYSDWLDSDNYGAPECSRVRQRLLDREDQKNAFVTSEYWKRAWITQEIVLARHLLLCTDRAYLDYALVPTHFSGPPHFLPDSRFKGAGLIELLHRHRTHGCSLKRDRLYSLRSLSAEKMNIDYSISDAEVFVQTLKAVRKNFCWCSAMLLAQTLELNEDNVPIELQAQEFEFSANPATWRKCCRSGQSVTDAWEFGGILVCMESVEMHFF